MSLQVANSAKLKKVLEKQRRFSFGDMSFQQAIDRGFYSEAGTHEVPKVQYNRRKYNRMNRQEQEHYETELKETKTEYYLVRASDSDIITPCPKSVFNYFNSI